MKVTTDACVFGAYVAHFIRTHALMPANIVDVGTGTGLLSLMLAQQLIPPYQIMALETDEAAWEQARENFALSPWSDHLQAVHADARSWISVKPVDLIISNPPFFHRQLSSVNEKRALAFHDHQLRLDELLCFADQHLADTGWLAVLLPTQRKKELYHVAFLHGLFLIDECRMYARMGMQNPHVVAQIYSKQKTHFNSTALTYQDHQGNYTSLFRQWLSPYYLYL